MTWRRASARCSSPRHGPGSEGRARLGDRLGDPDLTDDEAADLRTRLDDCGARAAVEDRIGAEVDAARAAIRDLPDGAARDVLAELTTWFTDRTG